MKIIILIFKLLFLGALFIVSNHDFHVGIESERGEFIDLYSEWLNTLFTQGVQLTSYVVKSEWLPDINS